MTRFPKTADFSHAGVSGAAPRRTSRGPHGVRLSGFLLMGVAAALGGTAHAQTPLTLVDVIRNGEDLARLGEAVAADGNQVAIGGNLGSLYLATRQGGVWGTPTLVLPPAGSAGLRDLAFEDGLLVRGMVGAVAVYDSFGMLTATLLPPGDGLPATGFGFGGSVAVTGDSGGTRMIVVGAALWPNDSGGPRGASIVFADTATGWQHVGTLQAPASAQGSTVGGLVAIADNGRVVATATRPHPSGTGNAGRLYVWEPDGVGGWLAATSIDQPGLVSDLDARGWGFAALASNKVRVFELLANAWTPTELSAPGVYGGVGTIDLHGRRIVAGGRGYVYYWEPAGGGGWTLIGSALNQQGFNQGRNFGNAVALTGQAIFAGWPLDATGDSSGDSTLERVPGSVHVFSDAPGCTTVTPAQSTYTIDHNQQTLLIDVDVVPEGCAWWAYTDKNWLGLSSRTGAADTSLSVVVPARSEVAPPNIGRSGNVTFGDGSTARVRQLNVPAPVNNCNSVVLDRYEETVSAAGGSFQVRVAGAPSTCRWSVAAGASWLAVTPTEGTGVEWATVDIDSYTGVADRVSMVTFGPRVFAVTQAGVATPVACGTTLVTDTSLNNDVDCTAIGEDETGITLADGVTLDLNGFELLGPGADVLGSVGVLIEGTQGAVVGGGAIRDFFIGAAVIDPVAFPFDDFSQIADIDDSRSSGDRSGRLTRGSADYTDVTFDANGYGVLSYESDVHVEDAVFTGQTKDAIADVIGGDLEVRDSMFKGNRTGIDSEAGLRLVIDNNDFGDHERPALQLVETGPTRVSRNRFYDNNFDPDEGRDFGQVNIEGSPSGIVTIQCNRFQDAQFNGMSALDPYPMAGPVGGHASIAIGEGFGGSPRFGSPGGARVQISENTFHSGDGGVALETGGTHIVSRVTVSNNNFRGGLVFGVGLREDEGSTWDVRGTGNFFAAGLAVDVIDPGGNSSSLNIGSNSATQNSCSAQPRNER